MSDKELNHVESVFHAVLELAPDDREAYLQQACNGDKSLYAEVSSLISAFDSRDGFIEEPALNLGFKILTQSSEQSMLGKSIGPYNVISRLGKGGMGEVYLAEDTRLGRKVALKFLSQEFVGDNWAKRQLVKEAQAAAMLDHPNICPVYGIEEIEDHLFIVMQYVEGETLADLIAKKAITLDQIIPLAKQIVGALAEAHAHGIIHRDIKPKNIMLNQSGHIKVLDFGLAKTVQPKKPFESIEDSISHLSFAGMVPGTVSYMSPEQLRAEKLDFRTDIFSFGIVLYELVSGANPYSRKNNADTISSILTETPPPLTKASLASKSLEPIIQRCLEKDRSERYQSSNDVLLALDNLVEGSSLPEWTAYLTRRAGVVLATILLLIVVTAMLYQRWNRRVYTVAVLPIVCEGIPESTCDGPMIQRAIIARISQRSDFRVVTANGSFELPGSNVALAETIGKQLNVNAVLFGKIFNRGNSVILQTRLEGTTGSSRLSENEYTLPSQAVPLLEEISIRLAFYPDIPPTEDEKKSFAALAAMQNRNPEAVEFYRRGVYYWNKRDRDNIQRAIGLFEEAIDHDPVYALAYSGLADCYVVMSSVAYGTLSTKDAMDRATAAAKKALEIDPNLAEAHTSIGVVQMKYNWNWREAEKAFKRAIELKPDYPAAHYWYSSLLGITHREKEALIESEKAKELDPLSPLYVSNLGRAYYRLRDYDRAIEYFTKVLEEKPDSASAMYILSYVYFQKGRYQEAIQLLERLSSVNKWYAAAPLGYAYAKTGRTDEARRILAEMENLPKSENLPAQERAIIYIGLDDKDAAFAWLEKSYEDRFASIISLTSEPIFDSLRSDPRFAVLAQKINLTP
jgi:serine/threonine-protein kinase